MYLGSLPTASNRARYVLALTVIDENTGEAVDLTGYDVTFAIRDPCDDTPLITLTVDNGIDDDEFDDGIIELTFTSTQMRTLDAKQYEVGCTITADGEDADQFIIGTIAVLDGVIS